MYREQDAALVAVEAEARSMQLAEVRLELEATQRQLWTLKASARRRRAVNLGALIGAGGALIGGAADACATGAFFGLIGLVVGWGLGTMLGLQGEIEPRPQDAPPARTTGAGGG